MIVRIHTITHTHTHRTNPPTSIHTLSLALPKAYVRASVLPGALRASICARARYLCSVRSESTGVDDAVDAPRAQSTLSTRSFHTRTRSTLLLVPTENDLCRRHAENDSTKHDVSTQAHTTREHTDTRSHTYKHTSTFSTTRIASANSSFSHLHAPADARAHPTSIFRCAHDAVTYHAKVDGSDVRARGASGIYLSWSLCVSVSVCVCLC